MPTILAAYAIALGTLVIGLWAVSLGLQRVPELRTEPWQIRFHIAAEALMGTTLIVGGLGWLAGGTWAPFVVLVGFGAAAYSAVNSAGYYAQLHQLAPVAMFGVILLLTLAALALGIPLLVG